ncbi:hypothetical protein IU500_06395 [Nocardia terpenica]|uniref:hypothetical protein n=1 Tax=Nocardia terpenica TaxID=455432 RepID=UPI0018962975|nr:hypothetical protein [Nocardia terpenica]MBF6060408.1 hypothetical protein [Nocardia terpenica]MBF6103668.1 hypothetical protein [Nocardia terpenica]MBF6111958.1 hypothetical protein [Nocardia terpenica]MBF6117889.1 hypothetical protein [Nocardia terpenica]MBF6155385.1 hypothetical protein [Nocardia terpenica]
MNRRISVPVIGRAMGVVLAVIALTCAYHARAAATEHPDRGEVMEKVIIVAGMTILAAALIMKVGPIFYAHLAAIV